MVDYLSPVTASLLAFYFTSNSGFSFGDPFRTVGTVVGGSAFFSALQYKLFLNLLAQIVPEIFFDIICIAAERSYGYGKFADEYWNTLTSLSGFIRFLPMFAMILAGNLSVILVTGKSACTEAQCVQGF